jgi:glycosyltransferase-like protein
MRIAMMTYRTHPRGGVVHSSKLAEHLSKLGVDVELFSLINKNEHQAEEPLEFYRPLQVPFTIFPYKSRTKEVIANVNQMIDEYVENLPDDFDLYHTHDCIGGNALHILKKNGLLSNPTVRTIHHIDSFRNKRLRNFQDKAVRFCDHKMVVSKYWQNYLKEKLSINASLSYNGVNTDLFNPRVKGESIREKHDLGDKPVILFVGGLEPRKGLEYLLFAMEHLKKRVPDVKLIVIGKGAFSSNRGECTFFNVLVKRLGIEDCVNFAFDIDDDELPKYYAACDVFALPSRMEGWGLSIMEAMATAKPVVATKVGGIPELVDNKVNGYLCNPGDSIALAKNIVHLLKNQDVAEEMGKEGLKKARSYSWEKTAKKVKSVYEGILEET